MRVVEVKRHVDGRVERFDCRLVVRLPHLAVLRFDHGEEGRFLPIGGRSFGFFWRRRAYVLYRIERSNGRVVAHRFDVVEGVQLDDAEVSYTDLLLDVRVDARGILRVEDEEEVAQYARRGLLSAAQRERIERTRALLHRRHAAIAREAARLLAKGGSQQDVVSPRAYRLP